MLLSVPGLPSFGYLSQLFSFRLIYSNVKIISFFLSLWFFSPSILFFPPSTLLTFTFPLLNLHFQVNFFNRLMVKREKANLEYTYPRLITFFRSPAPPPIKLCYNWICLQFSLPPLTFVHPLTHTHTSPLKLKKKISFFPPKKIHLFMFLEREVEKESLTPKTEGCVYKEYLMQGRDFKKISRFNIVLRINWKMDSGSIFID